MNAIRLDKWAKGTRESLERQGNGQVVTAGQRLASLRQENQRLASLLAEARDQVAALTRELESYRVASAGDRLVNMTEAASILKVHPSTISRWVAAGHFHTYGEAGKKPLIWASSLVRPPKKRRGKS